MVERIEDVSALAETTTVTSGPVFPLETGSFTDEELGRGDLVERTVEHGGT